MDTYFFSKTSRSTYFKKNIQPIKVGNSKYFIIGDFDLFNLKEIEKLVNLKNRPTEELILKLYLKYGINSFNKIYGEFSFLIYNKTREEIIIVRDPSSEKKIYYYTNDNELIISNKLINIVNKNSNLSFNEVRLIDDITNLSYNSNQTYYKEINFLRKGYYAKFTNQKIKILKKYYFIPEKIIKYTNINDYFDEFDFLINTAIRNRIKGHNNIGLALSSGYDSATLALNLNNNFQDKNLFSYTHAPMYKTKNEYRISDESPYVLNLLNKFTNFKGTIIRSENSSVIKPVIESLKYHPEPIHACSNLYWIHDIHKNAKKDNVSVILNAQHGNSTISWPSFKYNSTYNHFGKGLKGVVKRKLVNTLLYESYITLKSRTRAINNILHEDTLTTTLKQKCFKRLLYKNIYNFTKKKYRESLLFSEYIIANHYDIYGIESKDPTSDVKLINFLFNLPDIFFDNYKKQFLSQYLKHKKIYSILNSSKKGLQSADIEKRILNEKQYLANIINNKYEYTKYFNPQKIESSWNILRLLQKAVFLERFNTK